MSAKKRKARASTLPREATRDPCTIVIFGGDGDLALRMLYPALFKLHVEGELHPETRIIAVDISDMRKGMLWDKAYARLGQLKHIAPADHEWFPFAYRITYVTLDVSSPRADDWQRLQREISENSERTGGNVLFNISLPPHLYRKAVQGIGRHLLSRRQQRGWKRVMIEKPFGENKRSAEKLNSLLKQFFDESEIYRIDHYLGKETVQSILALRFANTVFEQLWDPRIIDYVQITAAEAIGVEGRNWFYDKAGALRDMVPSHLFQILALCAMSTPDSRDAQDIWRKQVEVLNAIQRIKPGDVVRGQYHAGNGMRTYGEDLGQESQTETYVAFRLFVTEGPFANRPIYLRTGKRLPRKLTQVLIAFQRPQNVLMSGLITAPNRLVINIQPEEGLAIRIEEKAPGRALALQPVDMQFDFTQQYPEGMPESYEAILLAALEGNLGFFSGGEQVVRCWALIDPIVTRFRRANGQGKGPEPYAAGTWGPPSPPAWPEWHNPSVEVNSRAGTNRPALSR
ncbi:MAG TPA: glucose-6-phosphate dehydrogenase [Oligoflexia bacterium]|nr:glucose-6-phosphate dehydrogenase [Oligoflexia bacterium]